MESTRQAKVNRLLQRELATILQRSAKRLINHQFITVTKVLVTSDLSHAKVYVTYMQHPEPEKLTKLLNQQVGDVKRPLGNNLKNELRKLPDLTFYYDDRLDYIDRIDQVLDDIKKDPSQSSRE